MERDFLSFWAIFWRGVMFKKVERKRRERGRKLTVDKANLFSWARF
jgi:hypothetical protein